MDEVPRYFRDDEDSHRVLKRYDKLIRAGVNDSRSLRVLADQRVETKQQFQKWLKKAEKTPCGSYQVLLKLRGCGPKTIKHLSDWVGIPIEPSQTPQRLKAVENAALRAVFEAAKTFIDYEHDGADLGWPDWDNKFDALKAAIDAARKET